MAERKTDITVTATAKTACITIKGVIYPFESDWFEYQINEHIRQGVTDCTIDLNSIGGNVIAANQIANIIKKFPGNVHCNIGALCASAATYIACVCKTREMAANGQFMIHKPEKPMEGNEDQIKSELKLLSNLTKDYRKVYAKVSGMSEAQIEELWRDGYWMDADEAKDRGFITSVGTDAEIDEEIVAMYKEAGCKTTPNITAKFKQTQNKMDNSLITAALGLPEDASDKAIAKAIANLNAKVTTLEASKTELETKITEAEATAKTELTAKVTALVDGGIKDNKFTEADRARFTKLATADFQTTAEVVASMKPYSPVTAAINNAGDSKVVDLYAGWDYEKFQKEAPQALAQMQNKEPDRFKNLKQEYIDSLKK